MLSNFEITAMFTVSAVVFRIQLHCNALLSDYIDFSDINNEEKRLGNSINNNVVKNNYFSSTMHWHNKSVPEWYGNDTPLRGTFLLNFVNRVPLADMIAEQFSDQNMFRFEIYL